MQMRNLKKSCFKRGRLKRMVLPLERRLGRDAAFAQGNEQHRRDEVGGGAGIASVVVGAQECVIVAERLPRRGTTQAEVENVDCGHPVAACSVAKLAPNQIVAVAEQQIELHLDDGLLDIPVPLDSMNQSGFRKGSD